MESLAEWYNFVLLTFTVDHAYKLALQEKRMQETFFQITETSFGTTVVY